MLLCFTGCHFVVILRSFYFHFWFRVSRPVRANHVDHFYIFKWNTSHNNVSDGDRHDVLKMHWVSWPAPHSTLAELQITNFMRDFIACHLSFLSEMSAGQNRYHTQCHRKIIIICNMYAPFHYDERNATVAWKPDWESKYDKMIRISITLDCRKDSNSYFASTHMSAPATKVTFASESVGVKSNNIS